MIQFPLYSDRIPYLTTAQMIEVDRAMIEDYKIDLIQMMENAGRNLAHLARNRFLDGNPINRSVVILAGTGGNGGGALVCARRLHNYGAEVRVYVTKSSEDFTPIPQHQFDILKRMGISIQPASVIDEGVPPDLVIDGIIGYSLMGSPRTTVANLIRWANQSSAPILALDAPSGIDTTTGTVFSPAIQATATMTLALPKAGLRADGVAQYVGELYLADISVPLQLYAKPTLGLDMPTIFAESDIVRLS
jgi:NAD(P)H-hydrate epimerase